VTEALVLGGGGVGGIAWITGLLTGLADAGQDVTGAETVVGTSAGANVAAQLGGALSLEELYARQVEPELMVDEITADLDPEAFGSRLADLSRDADSVTEVRRAVGRFALEASTPPEPRRRQVIEARLPSHEWPACVLRIVVVDAESGQPRVLDKTSGASLVDAVMASSAVPGVWPPVAIDGRRYVDGGVRSGSNADYAAGASRVLVVVPLGSREMVPTEKSLGEELRAGGAEVTVLAPDDASASAIGPNPLDPATRRPAAEAGRAQGRGVRIEWGGA
jgi:NTE family protein